MLLPGGPGYVHDTGKDEGYCLQYPNGTKFVDKKTGKDYCEDGHSLEVVVTPEYKWQWKWVEIYEMQEGPSEGVLRYVLPEEAPNDIPELDFVKPKYYMPAQAHPVFELTIYKGTPRKIAYSFNNTDIDNPDAYNPEFCYMDWPPGNLMEPCHWKSCPDQRVKWAGHSPQVTWDIRNCENITEGTYTVQIGSWNPLDDWLWLDKPMTVEVLSRIGPIFIDDFNQINDKNETKPFNIRLGKMGLKTCITVDFGDGSKVQFFGNVESCKARYQTLTENDVTPVDHVAKNFDINHVFEVQGLYKVIVTGFDERGYAEESLDVTIFRMPCKVPQVWLPVNETSWLRPERVPKNYRSKPYQVASASVLECNKTVNTFMEWSCYSVDIKKDPQSQTGLIEELTEIQINETVPSYTSSLIDIPGLTLETGLYKLVFKLEIETGVAGLPLFKTAYTYFNVTQSPLVPGFIKGSVSKVTRGWGQTLKLDAKAFSIDPDDPMATDWNVTWWCRRVDSDPPEEFPAYYELDTDNDGITEKFPVHNTIDEQRIPRPRDPIIINPPEGCFGYGPGPMKVTGTRLTLNTSSLVTYAQVYEVSIVLSKDVRQAQVGILIDVGVIPAPIVEIDCASAGLCFPATGAIFINPTSRLALLSSCVAECETGDITYNWKLTFPPVQEGGLISNFDYGMPNELQTTMCDPEKMTTTTTTTRSTTTSTTTSTSTTTLPPNDYEIISTFIENTTDVTYVASLDSSGTIFITYNDTTGSGKKRRRKRQIGGTIELGTEQETAVSNGPVALIPKKLKTGCTSVFPAGIDNKEFSIKSEFFKMNPTLKAFIIDLNVTRCIYTGIGAGRKLSCSTGISTLNIKVNDPPVDGKCVIQNLGLTEEMNPVNPGENTALLDIFQVQCSSWKDPNQHALVKYVFKVIEETPRGNETRLLYSGPLDKSKAVFGVGKYYLFAEIWDEAGAFSTYDIATEFRLVLPTQEQYEAYDLQGQLKAFTDVGDGGRVAMILQADASIKQRANWFSLEDLMGDKTIDEMGDVEKENYQSLLKNLTNVSIVEISTQNYHSCEF